MTDTTPLPEFAPEYTRAERIRLIAIIVVVAAGLAAASKFWFIPALAAFAATAICRDIGGIDGVTLLYYGTMVGFPLLAAILTGAIFGWRGYKTVRDRQFPPLGEKVMRPTPIRRGKQAVFIGSIHQLAFLPLLALAGWGYLQARIMTESYTQHTGTCLTAPAAKPAVLPAPLPAPAPAPARA